jgi:hypothetical protein
MTEKYQSVSFSACDLNNSFFDSLKADYIGFDQWFHRKATEGAQAYVFSVASSINAFVYLKDENEEIVLIERTIPKEMRVKIGTLKLSDDIQGQRLGEGALGLALRHWQKSKYNQIYITVFSKHKRLIDMLLKFGFSLIGHTSNGENVYVKDRRKLNFDSPYTSFPFIHNTFCCAGYIPIEYQFHDTLFQYSELSRTNQEAEEKAAANGISKVFIATPSSRLDYFIGKPVIIYRVSDQSPKKYHSVASLFCTITKQTYIKTAGKEKYTFEQFREMAGNKTLYDEIKLREAYGKYNVVLLEMVYYSGSIVKTKKSKPDNEPYITNRYNHVRH